MKEGETKSNVQYIYQTGLIDSEWSVYGDALFTDKRKAKEEFAGMRDNCTNDQQMILSAIKLVDGEETSRRWIIRDGRMTDEEYYIKLKEEMERMNNE